MEVSSYKRWQTKIKQQFLISRVDGYEVRQTPSLYVFVDLNVRNLQTISIINLINL